MKTHFTSDSGLKTACGYIRDGKMVVKNGDLVDCKRCLKSAGMTHYNQLNGALTDSQGCI